MERMIAKHQPDVVVAQGDTTTVLAAALTAFYTNVPFAHVEAGLRTRNLGAPFPEEFNRVAADRLARWHFCPTRGAAANLLAEGIDPAQIIVTGNTGIDALRLALERLPPAPANKWGMRRILLTAHRRENHGPRMEAICRAIVALVREFDDIEFAIPVHPNPEVRATFERLRVAHERVRLMPPLSYPRLVAEMARASDRHRFRRHSGRGAVSEKAGAGDARCHGAAGSRRAWGGAAGGGRNCVHRRRRARVAHQCGCIR
jgi:UDP-N-acetylglucosamine 2-epimerase (non-hydrolysing)